ncbi:uncharacterized protein Z518_03405 [Rhinocladiella mackenziei CBS 650.93]|uniref:DNA polymerase delta subunit 3 n=1 Tax=Rhinocladiella mackenziei CBS 650.93 TaxID=1442369 RepID=A0A0D2HDW0_9EURO|nr:uncharacterized protein Z518_03405 [Rhinocladiella mackenziei CBS 650.93]KIX08748.1 hypothetical protein Z518_03405 [Rhinocladiella mackenziei CBS 650.93]
MSEDFKRYLATEIISEQRTISYRHVSRALKVHVNAAKCMLYDFYEFQNGKKPGSIYATYLVCGVKKRQMKVNGTANGDKHPYDEDEPIPSSPPPFTSSMLEPSQPGSQATEEEEDQVPVRTITLVREEDLEAMKEQYQSITSIHIYSLSPVRIQDLVTLTDISRGLFSDYLVREDPLLMNKTYGVIQNPQVRRRKGKRPVTREGPAPKFQPVQDEPKTFGGAKSSTQTKPAPRPSAPASAVKKEDSSRPSSRDSTSTTASSRQPSLRRDAVDLFKVFAKQGQHKSRPAASQPAANDQDTKMTDADDDDEGESEDEALFLDTGTRKPATTKKRSSDVKKEREDKAAKLRKMMESDDEEEPAVPDVENVSGVHEEPPAGQKGTDVEDDDEEVAWSESDTENKEKSAASKTESPRSKAHGQQSATTESVSTPRRRRGKRKVMKKRTTKDEDGYLVTKEEAVWESYSEDEPEPAPTQRKKEMPRSSFGGGTGKTQSQVGKSGAAKRGGSIMSFFGKKN